MVLCVFRCFDFYLLHSNNFGLVLLPRKFCPGCVFVRDHMATGRNAAGTANLLRHAAHHQGDNHAQIHNVQGLGH